MFTDASAIAIGATLAQLDEKGEISPVDHMSHALERPNWHPYQLERGKIFLP